MTSISSAHRGWHLLTYYSYYEFITLDLEIELVNADDSDSYNVVDPKVELSEVNI